MILPKFNALLAIAFTKVALLTASTIKFDTFPATITVPSSQRFAHGKITSKCLVNLNFPAPRVQYMFRTQYDASKTQSASYLRKTCEP